MLIVNMINSRKVTCVLLSVVLFWTCFVCPFGTNNLKCDQKHYTKVYKFVDRYIDGGAIENDQLLDLCRDIREAMGMLVWFARHCVTLNYGRIQVQNQIRRSRQFLNTTCERDGGIQARWSTSACYRYILSRECNLISDNEQMIVNDMAVVSSESDSCGYYREYRDCVIRAIKSQCKGEDKPYVITYLLDNAKELAYQCQVHAHREGNTIQVLLHPSNSSNSGDIILADSIIVGDSCVEKIMVICLKAFAEERKLLGDLSASDITEKYCPIFVNCMKQRIRVDCPEVQDTLKEFWQTYEGSHVCDIEESGKNEVTEVLSTTAVTTIFDSYVTHPTIVTTPTTFGKLDVNPKLAKPIPNSGGDHIELSYPMCSCYFILCSISVCLRLFFETRN